VSENLRLGNGIALLRRNRYYAARNSGNDLLKTIISLNEGHRLSRLDNRPEHWSTRHIIHIDLPDKLTLDRSLNGNS
jgi:hypothetical protein